MRFAQWSDIDVLITNTGHMDDTYHVDLIANAPAGWSALLDDGRRAWAHVNDPQVLEAMSREEFCGRSALLADHTATF